MSYSDTRIPWFSKDVYNFLLPHLIEELERQVLIHKLVARFNLYYKLQKSSQDPKFIPYLWTMLYDTIKLAVQNKSIFEFTQDNHWISLPKQSPSLLDSVYKLKSPVYRLWKDRASDEASNHAENVIRSILSDLGYKMPPHKFSISDLNTGEECIPDAFIFSPSLAGFELKNITSDIISDPRPLVGKPYQALYTKIDRHFRLCSLNGIHPLLIAPRVDPSFDKYEVIHKGLHFEVYYQLLPLHHATLCKAINRHLLFPYVLSLSDKPPFPSKLKPLIDNLQNLTSLLAKY